MRNARGQTLQAHPEIDSLCDRAEARDIRVELEYLDGENNDDPENDPMTYRVYALHQGSEERFGTTVKLLAEVDSDEGLVACLRELLAA